MRRESLGTQSPQQGGQICFFCMREVAGLQPLRSDPMTRERLREDPVSADTKDKPVAATFSLKSHVCQERL